MSKIYGVFISSFDEETNKPINSILKTFKDIKKAENYRDELIAEEIEIRHMRYKCLACGAHSYNCPYYVEGDYGYEECNNYEYYAFHQDTYYSIVDMELEE